MSGQAPEFWLPYNQERLMTSEDHALHEMLHSMSLRTFMHDIEAHGGQHYYDNEDGFITLHDLRGQNEAASNQALVMLRPFGNGNTPAMLLRDRVYQAFLGDQIRVIGVPNNMFGRKVYDLPGETDAAILLARKTVHALVDHGIESVVISGESQGATIGGFMMALAKDDLGITAVSLKDAPDTVERTPKQLQKDFQGQGLENLHRLNMVIQMTDLPALVTAQSAGYGLDSIKQMAGLVRFQLGALSGENKRLHQAMARRTFVQNLVTSGLMSQLGDHAQVVRYEQSAICTPDIEHDMATYGMQEQLLTVRHLGHEGTDHIVLNALLTRAAIEGTALAA